MKYQEIKLTVFMKVRILICKFFFGITIKKIQSGIQMFSRVLLWTTQSANVYNIKTAVQIKPNPGCIEIGG